MRRNECVVGLTGGIILRRRNPASATVHNTVSPGGESASCPRLGCFPGLAGWRLSRGRFQKRWDDSQVECFEMRPGSVASALLHSTDQPVVSEGRRQGEPARQSPRSAELFRQPPGRRLSVFTACAIFRRGLSGRARSVPATVLVTQGWKIGEFRGATRRSTYVNNRRGEATGVA